MSDKESGRIEISHWRRFWNRNKKVLLFLLALVVLAAVFFILKGIKSGDNKNAQPATAIQSSTSKIVNPQEVISAPTQAASQSATQAQSETQAQTTETPANGNVIVVTDKAESQKFTSDAFFINTMLLGDTIASGFSAYGFIAQEMYVGGDDPALTTISAANYVSNIVKSNPDKILLLMGVNDINFNNRSIADIAKSYSEIVNSLKTKLPQAKIYIISVLPVGQSNSTANVTNDKVKSLNAELAKLAQGQVKMIDFSTALADSTGYLNPEVSTNGLNIKVDYYPFILNSIAKFAK